MQVTVKKVYSEYDLERPEYFEVIYPLKTIPLPRNKINAEIKRLKKQGYEIISEEYKPCLVEKKVDPYRCSKIF